MDGTTDCSDQYFVLEGSEDDEAELNWSAVRYMQVLCRGVKGSLPLTLTSPSP